MEVEIDEVLSAEELSFFKQYGYLIKRRAADLKLCQRILDRMWDTAPAHLDRDDPATWTPIPQELESNDPLLYLQQTRWQFRGASTEPELLQLVFSAPIKTWAEQLLGAESLRAPVEGGKPMGSWGPAWPDGPVDPQLGEGVRGIYATLPELPDASKAEDRLHTDGHPFHLGVVCLLDDCPPEAGAFKIWPQSHQRFYPLFPMQYDQARIPFYEHLPSHKGIIHPPEYLAEIANVEADTPAVDCYGGAGDVVFWHHRLGHMAGQNRARSPSIRQAVLYDFCKSDLDQTRLDPPQANMWRDWSDALQQADAPISAQFAAEQRLPLSLLNQGSQVHPSDS
ncbi:MAG: phytanoyl-CoA dioxygenase family protein [Pseudomonadales bacterium]